MNKAIFILTLPLLTACLGQSDSGSAMTSVPAAPIAPVQPTPTPTPAAAIPTTAADVDAALVGTWVQQGNANNTITFSGRNVTYSTNNQASTTHTHTVGVVPGVPTVCAWTADSLAGASSAGQLQFVMDILTTNSSSGSPATAITNCMYSTAGLETVSINFQTATCAEMQFHMQAPPYPVYCKQ